jgi:Glycosyl hydrolases family 2, TIM barrel domain
MMIRRRKLIRLITGFAAAITSPILLSLYPRKYSTPTRKINLPFFGWYDNITNINFPAQVSSEGIDLLMPYVEEANKAEIQEFLDASSEAEMKVLLELSRPLVESESISGVKDFVRTYKNHPSVYAWYLYDEPEVKKPKPLSPVSLQRLYQTIKKEDNSKPVALVISKINKIKYYTSAMDILMWDSYPCENGVAEFEWVPSYRRELHEIISFAAVKNKKFWNVLQAYGENQFNKRLPTKAEFRYMFYSSILGGVDGLLFWSHYRSSLFWNELVLYPTIKEARYYIPVMVKGKDLSSQVQVNNSNIEVKLFSIPNTQKYLMIVVNHNRLQSNFTIKLTQKLAGKLVAINQEAITNLSAQASFDINLSPYEIRLYQIG